MQSSKQPLVEEVPKHMDADAVKNNLHPDDSIQIGHVYIYCQRKGCGTWRRMDKAHVSSTEDDLNRWIGVKIYEAYDPSQAQRTLMTKSEHDKVAMYYCCEQCAVAGEL